MGMPFRRVSKLAATMTALVVVGASCGASEEPSLTEAAGPASIEAPAAALAEPKAAAEIPAPRAPELLGLGSALEVGGTPVELGFQLEEDADTSDAEASAGVLAFDGSAQSAILGEASDPLEAPIGDAPDDEQLSSTEESVGADVEPEPLPTPPPAATRIPAPYPDPSINFLKASGRSLDLFGETAPDGTVLPGTTRGVSPQSISVAGLGSLSLAGSDFRVGVCLGAQARFEQANFYNELTRSIDFDGCYDDTAQPDLAAGFSAALVADEVFAVVPLASPAFGAQELLQSERVPYIGDEALPGFCGRTTTLGFGTWGAQACPVLETRGFVTLTEPVLTAYLATIESGSPGTVTYLVEQGSRGQAVVAARKFEAELVGMQEPEFLAVLPSAAQGAPLNWTEVVGAALATEPDVVMVEGGATGGLANALKSLGFEGEFVYVGRFDPLNLADVDARVALAPATIISPGVDLATRRGEGWVSLSGAAAALGVDEAEIGLDFVEGYVAADMFVAAAEATQEPFTVERFADTINAGWWYPGVDGVACGSWWPAGHFATTPCVSVSRVGALNEALVPVLGLVQTEPQLRFELGGS